jgi:hypothetical protein
MIKLINILKEGTFDSKEHIAIFTGPDGTANVYKLVDGTYYAQVEGDPSYDIVAKDVIEMAIKLKKDGLTTRVAGELEEGVHDPVKPGILKKRLGKLSCSRVRSAKSKLKDKGTHYAKALQRYLNYHC